MTKLGCDLALISRIAESLKKPGFKEKIFHAQEISYCEQRVQREESYAARFAAKEAFAKALGTGLYAQGITPLDIWIINDAQGKPVLHFSTKVTELLRQQNLSHSDVSLSHQGEYALACVVLS